MKRITLSDLYVGTPAERAANFPGNKEEGVRFLEVDGGVYAVVGGDWILLSPADLALLKTGGVVTGPIVSSSTVQAKRLLADLYDRRLGTHPDDTHFDTVSATYPSGWTQQTAAGGNDVSTTLDSFWRILATSSDTFYGYHVQTTTDFENDVATDGWHSWTFGPILAPRVEWTDAVGYHFGIHRDNSGIDFNTYSRIRLYWDNAQVRYTLRGEYSDGSNSGTSTAIVAGFPLAPLYVRVAMCNSTAQTFRAYAGFSPEPKSMALLYEVDPVSPATFGTVFMRVTQFRGTGPDSELFLGAIVSQSGVE